MNEQARLLTGAGSSLEDSKVARLLSFFGVACRTTTAGEFLGELRADQESPSKYRLLCVAEVFSQLMDSLERAPGNAWLWQESVHSVFVYAGSDSAALGQLVEGLTGDSSSALHKPPHDARDWTLSDGLADFCGSLSGLRVTVNEVALDECRVVSLARTAATPIISSGSDLALVKFDRHGVPVFLSLCGKTIDIDAELATPNFDIRDYLFSAVPPVLYIKWAFAGTAWRAQEASACLIIDDPLLKPTYGFVRFRELLALMEKHKFSTNIAFIPWNWRRNDAKVVRLFKDNPTKYSLSVHGCDHTAAEFGTQDRERLGCKVSQAAKRMSDHETKTGLGHDRVMVFPQGVFSNEAIEVLKHANFTAVVNTEVSSTSSQAPKIRISDVWDVAVMAYGSFPIYTRRYPSQGIENLAFDILLGKPCLIVIHHDFCRERCRHLVNFIERLNALNSPLSWRPLGEVVKRSYRQREVIPGEVEIEMYGSEMLVENRSNQRKHFEIKRREFDSSAIEDVRSGSSKLVWSLSGGYLHFAIDLDPGESAAVTVKFHELKANGQLDRPLSYKIKTSLRRHLSEARDNYIVPIKSRLAAFSRS
jgi:hypothetical protein